MLKKASLFSVVLLSTTFTSAGQAFAENWLTTDRISNQREIEIQIDKDSVRRDGENWITFMQRLQVDSNSPYKPLKGEVNCVKKVFGTIHSNGERNDQFRRDGKWFYDFARKGNPGDVVSVEVDSKDDDYREATFSWICSNYKK